MPKITFLPQNIETECLPNETILDAGKRIGAGIKTICGGVGSCAACVVKIIEGEECLNAPNKDEEKHLGNTYFITRKRLGCQCEFIKDGEVKIEVLNENGQ